MVGGISYRRGLNGRTVAKWFADGKAGLEAARARRWLTGDETAQLQEEARRQARDLFAAIQEGQAALDASLDAQADRLFERVLAFDQMRYQQDVDAYHRVYLPVGILPPDQYMAVVLQATEGCSFNTCTFCDFYRDRRFRIKTTDQFRQHAQAVRAYLAEGLALRRTLFLGDANALVVPMPRLLELLAVTREVFDVERLGGIYAFLDGFSGEKKTAADYQHLAALGVRRIYIGMESGNPALLRLLKKPGSPEDVLQAVQAIKAGGIAVGVIALLGAGGQSYAQAHVHDTIQLLNAMDLDLDDLVYFSELIESEGLEYTRTAFQQQLKPLDTSARIAQGEEIERGLVFRPENGIPHISRYDIREFVY